MDNKNSDNFSLLRGIFFPIHWHELRKFIPMALMMLFILCNYTILRNTKDTLVVTAKGSDAEIISFLKLWGTMPCAFLFLFFYSKITDLLNREKIFYLCIAPFLIFFGAFAFLIYPNVNVLHPDPTLVAQLKASYPNFKWFIAIWGNWSYSLFYILAELWGSVMLSLLFWQFANDIVKKDQTKRFYPLFGLIGNVGLIISGILVKYFSKPTPGVADPYQISLNYLMPCIVIGGIIITALFFHVNRVIDNNPDEVDHEKSSIKKKKEKLSLKESFRLLITSPHLLCIALIVLGYGITINYVDVIWKGQAKAYFAGNKNAFSDYMGSFAMTTGLLSIPIMLIGGNILRRLSWRSSAAITPTILLITGTAFFSLILTAYWSGNIDTALFTVGGIPITFLGLGVHFGLLQNSLTKATKYSLFDPTKEMAFIPLDKNFKTKGKAAVDVVGGRLGKSGGALTFFLLQTALPGLTLVNLIPFLFGLTLVILAVWYGAIWRLDKSIQAIEAGETESKAQEVAPALQLQAAAG